MKKYRIKNEAIEKSVCGLFATREAFEKQLNAWSEYHFNYYSNYSCIKIVVNSADSITGYACELYVATSDVEELIEYNPRVWNEYPKVTPPKKGWYRIQYEVEDVGYVRRVVYWNGKEWETHHSFVEKLAFGFKPWDDEEGKE